MAQDGMRDVVLADDEADGPAGVRPARGEPRDLPPARRGPRRRAVVAGAAVAVLSAVAVAVVQGAGDRQRAARLEGAPGFVTSMSTAPSPLWGVPGGSRHLVLLDGDMLLTGFLEDGEQRLVANDAESGRRLWQTALAHIPIGRSLACDLLGRGGRAATTHVVCHLAVSRPAGVDFPGYGPGSEQRLVVLDARTGEVLDDRSLGLGFSAATVDDGDVIVADVRRDGHVGVVRQDAVTGEVRWTFTSAAPLPGTGRGVGPPVPDVRVEGDVIVLEGSVSWALGPGGRALGEWRSAGGDGPPGPDGPDGPPIGGPLEVSVLGDGRFAVGDPGSAGTPGARYGEVVTPDGRERFAIDGPVLPLVVDDGSAADVLFTVPPGGGRVVAVDSSSGDRLWEAEPYVGGEAMVLDRRLVSTSLNRLTAVDTRTGRQLWTALPGDVVSDQHLFTDGHVVAVATRTGTAAAFTAVDLADGRVRWTATGPADVRGYVGADGRLFALRDDQVVRVG